MKSYSAGYPLITYFTTQELSTFGGYNIGGINGTGQIPSMVGNWGLIDKDTPQEALTKISYTDNEEWELVFSDEFNVDGRTFYPGDDPYWEAVDLHYWATNDLEWYSSGTNFITPLCYFIHLTIKNRTCNNQRW